MTTFTPTDYVIEPANVQVLRCVRSVSLANKPRRIIPNGAENDINNEYFSGYDLHDAYAQKNTSSDETRCGLNLTGDLILEAGYNCEMRVSGTNITVSARAGGGASIYGNQPAEIPVTEEEEAVLKAGDYLSGGPKCFKLVDSVNGIKGDAISVSGGNGVSVEGSYGQLVIRMTANTAAEAGCDVRTC